MSALGVLGMINFFSNDFEFEEAPKVLIGVYMCFFSVLLFLYELMWWMTIDSVNKIIRRNFGFMYGVKGKAAYLIFVAALCIGFEGIGGTDIQALRFFTGIFWCVNGVLHLFLWFVHPELVKSYSAPTGGFDLDDDMA